jgi:PKD repeat protein
MEQVMTINIKRALGLVIAAFSAACTISDTTPPPLTGPSEMSLSLAISANPDVLSLDGASQSQIVIEAREANGQPAANVPLRVEILANGTVTDFGTLSARTLVTSSSGRAGFTYTAPPFSPGTIPDLSLGVTPTGSNAATLLRRVVDIRLVPPGVIGIAPTAVFTFNPETPVAFSNVLFDGSASTGGVGAAIASYRWDFGDGTSGSGLTSIHQYSAAGIYRVTLTVTDTNGLSSTTAPQLVPVTVGVAPTAAFIFSPTAPVAGSDVFFNGSTSTAGAGHRVVSYRWNWGDGTANSSGVTRSHKFAAAGTYVVVLTVTDEVGQTAVTTKDVTVDP